MHSSCSEHIMKCNAYQTIKSMIMVININELINNIYYLVNI